MKVKRIFLFAPALALSMVATSLLTPGAQVMAQDTELKNAEAVLDAYAKAIGGKEAFAKLKNRRVKATLSIPAAGITGKVTTTQSSPKKHRMEADLPGVGKIVQICDGEKVYENNPFMGKRYLEGAEKNAVFLEADFRGDVNWRDTYKSAKLLGTEEVGGRPCYKVELQSKSGMVRTNYYDAETKLMSRTDMEMETIQGKMKIVTLVSDYKMVDGINYPHSSEQQVMGVSQQVTVDSIEHNVDIPAGQFEVPALDS